MSFLNGDCDYVSVHIYYFIFVNKLKIDFY